jgi:anti-sigma regulatory factor (Ser/Thr protein kinase)
VTATGRADAGRYEPTTIEAALPDLVLEAPTPIAARHAIRGLAQSAGAASTVADDLVSAVSEVVTNARVHGAPPVRLHAWVAEDGEDGGGPARLVVVVSDRGEGVSDQQIGAEAPVPRAPGHGGFGLFLARQLCDEVALGSHAGTHRVRLVRYLG